MGFSVQLVTRVFVIPPPPRLLLLMLQGSCNELQVPIVRLNAFTVVLGAAILTLLVE